MVRDLIFFVFCCFHSCFYSSCFVSTKYILVDAMHMCNFMFLLESETEQGIFDQVLHGDLDFVSEPWPSISNSAKDLVRKMLVRDPKKRLTAHEVLCEYAVA